MAKMGKVYDLEMEVHVCSCGLVWAAPKDWNDEKRNDHSTFYCPNGCTRHYPGLSDLEKVKQEKNGQNNNETPRSTGGNHVWCRSNLSSIQSGPNEVPRPNSGINLRK